MAVALSKYGKRYEGKSNALWYDSDSFFELISAAGGIPVRKLVESFEGLSGKKAGLVASAFLSRSCNSLSQGEAEELLQAARKHSKQVSHRRFGCLGRDMFINNGYSKRTGYFELSPGRGEFAADIPFVAEAWAERWDFPFLLIFVNRTPVPANMHMGRILDSSKSYAISGCGIADFNSALRIEAGMKGDFKVVINVTTPYMPITTDGKEPDLSCIQSDLCSVMEEAIRRARRCGGLGHCAQKMPSKKDVIKENLKKGISKASGDGKFRYSLRQLFYAVRPSILDVFGTEPDYGYFCQVITEIEAENDRDLPGIYRDNRGVLYHPHTSEEIALGTLSVEQYERPEWTFNKVLYCEKEGFFSLLKDVKWPERNDCALLTSKGFASRAARDVLDLIGETDEAITFFCIHDSDGPGTLIYQTLQGATAARRERSVKVINLGLDPEEAISLGLQVESFNKDGKRTVPVADYVSAEGREWLQSNRVELNAMDSQTFLEWLDAKFANASGKVIPPENVMGSHLQLRTRSLLRETLLQRTIRETKLEERTDHALSELSSVLEEKIKTLNQVVEDTLGEQPEMFWKSAVEQIAESLVVESEGDSGTS